MSPTRRTTGDGEKVEATIVRFDYKKRRLVKSIFAQNSQGEIRNLDTQAAWYLERSVAPWKLCAEVLLPIRFGYSVVSVDLELDPVMETATVSVGLFPPRLLLVD